VTESIRRLAAILSTDAAGYSRLMAEDEAGTIQTITAYREVISGLVRDHRGRVVDMPGDNVLAEFPAALDAVECAVEMQRELKARNADLPPERRMEFRIGVNLGDVTAEGDRIYGNGVNVAARIESLADPGGVCISGTVLEQVRGKADHVFDDLGHKKVKNISNPVHVYALRMSETSPIKGRGPFFSTSTDKSPLITGSCLCGEVRFQLSEMPSEVSFCHCRMCQKASGGQIHASAIFPRTALRFTRGEPKYYKSSPLAERGFCANCGSSLTYRPLLPNWSDWIDVVVACFDNPEDFSPTWHLGVESQMPWADINDDLPRVRCEDSPALIEAWKSVGMSGVGQVEGSEPEATIPDTSENEE